MPAASSTALAALNFQGPWYAAPTATNVVFNSLVLAALFYYGSRTVTALVKRHSFDGLPSLITAPFIIIFGLGVGALQLFGALRQWLAYERFRLPGWAGFLRKDIGWLGAPMRTFYAAVNDRKRAMELNAPSGMKVEVKNNWRPEYVPMTEAEIAEQSAASGVAPAQAPAPAKARSATPAFSKKAQDQARFLSGAAW
jgi:hypothetical protein